MHYYAHHKVHDLLEKYLHICTLMYVKKRMSLTLSRCNQKIDPNPLFFINGSLIFKRNVASFS